MRTQLDADMDRALAPRDRAGRTARARRDRAVRPRAPRSSATHRRRSPPISRIIAPSMPTKEFLVAGDERLTYAQVHAAAERAARALVARGVKRGDRIGIAMRNSPSWIVLYMADDHGGRGRHACSTAGGRPPSSPPRSPMSSAGLDLRRPAPVSSGSRAFRVIEVIAIDDKAPFGAERSRRSARRMRGPARDDRRRHRHDLVHLGLDRPIQGGLFGPSRGRPGHLQLSRLGVGDADDRGRGKAWLPRGSPRR